MRIFALSLMISLFAGPLSAQMRVVSVEKLPLSHGREWNQPVFSHDGSHVYFTDGNFNGIWEYSFSTRAARQITAAPGSGFGFAISGDGRTISYRTTLAGTTTSRVQELVEQDISSGAVNVLERGESVSLPRFVRSSPVHLKGGKAVNVGSAAPADTTALMGIENTKIALLRNGRIVSLDPLGGGSYIWPSLSPDGTRLLAYEMDRGAFISDLSGKVTKMLGRRDNPVWTRDGRWIVYADDRDNGETITSSDICCVSADGATTVRLTNRDDVVELCPTCSPVENKIAFSSLNGDIYVITYSEEGGQ